MRTYIKFLINVFTLSLSKVFIVFFSIIFLSNILEQAEFFKELEFSFIYLVFLSFLNTPSIVFEILPFIFLISTQIFFIYLIDKNELEIFKYKGLTNYKIVKIISTYTLILGLIFVLFFYNISSVLKNSYLVIKNNYTNDSKYLAVINKNGLWIKDEINEEINIINANQVDNEFLLDVSITQFNKNFESIRVIHADKINISSTTWDIFNPIILEKGIKINPDEIKLRSNFDLEKINGLFSNLSSLNIFELIKLRKSYKSLNYSVTEIESHLYKLFSYPLYLTLITVFAAIIMFNISYQKNSLFKVVFGIFLSVIIYYINNFFNVLGTTEKIPLLLSIFLPLIILSIINITSLIKLNEK
ncbi:LptF/LptG family permease [Candidatus Pelagibacter sp.]|jgi:lipopolysaccharide export system permease protein|nr:LptF/LptG family permease [Candidatus Pelagibacter sp.]